MTAFQIRLQCFMVKQSWEGVVHGYGDGGGDAAVLWLVLSVNQADVKGFGRSAAPYYNNNIIWGYKCKKNKTIMSKNCV